MSRRSRFAPWTAAGRRTEQAGSADDVVQEVGWVFTPADASSLGEFVATGDAEVATYVELFGLAEGPGTGLVEIGCGIGRMTCALTRRIDTVYACDIDGGFLERCREAVAAYGSVDHLRTIEVDDGRSLAIENDAVDSAFSYLTLQNCSRPVALALVAESIRVTRRGGRVALNFRTWSTADTVLVPLGSVVRAVGAIPGLGRRMADRKMPTRLGWQAPRLDPYQVLHGVRASADRQADPDGDAGGDGDGVGKRLTNVEVWRHPDRSASLNGLGDVATKEYAGINPSHWWLVADVA